MNPTKVIKQAIASLKKHTNLSNDILKNSVITIAKRLKNNQTDMGSVFQDNNLTLLRLNNPEILENLCLLPDSSLCRQPSKPTNPSQRERQTNTSSSRRQKVTKRVV
jgi:hypothetical protein